MGSAGSENDLEERYLTAMLEATFPLQEGPDREATLHALIRAAEMLKDRLERELEELREESD